MKKRKRKLLLGALALCAGGAAYYKWNIRIPLKEYTQHALYMAALDDEICRNELDGVQLDGGTVTFPPKSESLKYRYHLFLNLNRKKSRAAIQKETARLEQRLHTSRVYEERSGEALKSVFVSK